MEQEQNIDFVASNMPSSESELQKYVISVLEKAKKNFEENESIPVIGVAKTEYKDAESIKVRGGLFVTASGIDAVSAAKYIESMHGKFKNPTILKNVDHLSRGIYKENKRPSKS